MYLFIYIYMYECIVALFTILHSENSVSVYGLVNETSHGFHLTIITSLIFILSFLQPLIFYYSIKSNRYIKKIIYLKI